MKRLFAIAVLSVLGLSSNAYSTEYTFISIDFPGNEHLKVNSTGAAGINDKGQIVGTFEAIAGLDQYNLRTGYLLSNNHFETIFGYGETSLADINNNSVIAGTYNRGGSEGISLGFSTALSKWGNYSEPIPYLPTLERAMNSYLGGVNDAGHVAGSYEVDHEDTSGFIYNGTSFKGIYEGLETYLHDINNNNQVVGSYWAADLQPVGFLLDGTGAVSTISYPDALSTEALALNDKGVIVGAYNLGDYSENVFGPDQGFLFDGEYHTINFPGAESTSISGINNLGYLVGSYSDGEKYHGFLAVPTTKNTTVPEPSVMILFGLAGAGVFAAHRYSRFDNGSRLA